MYLEGIINDLTPAAKLADIIMRRRNKITEEYKTRSLAEIVQGGGGKLRDEKDIRARVTGDRILLSDVFDIDEELEKDKEKTARLESRLAEFDQNIIRSIERS